MLELFESNFASSQGLARLFHVHFSAKGCCKVLSEISWRVLSKINSLSCEHFVSLIFDNIHLFAKFDLTAVQVHQDINVECMHDLVLLGEELLAVKLLLFVVLGVPDLTVDLLVEKVFVL